MHVPSEPCCMTRSFLLLLHLARASFVTLFVGVHWVMAISHVYLIQSHLLVLLHCNISP